MANSDRAVRPRGRPKASPEGRGSTLTITINPQTRASLEAAAGQLGRSLSQTAEYAIERGRIVGELGAAGSAVADVLQNMLRTAIEIRDTIGDPTTSVQARDELRRSWAMAAQAALPNVSVAPPGQAAAKAAISAMRHAAIDAFGELHALAASESALADAADHVRKISNAQLYPGSPGWQEAAEGLQSVAEMRGGAIAELLDLVLRTAEAAERANARYERSQNERP